MVKSHKTSAAQFVMLVGVTTVLFFLALVPLEVIPEIPVDIDSKPFFVPLALVALLPMGRPGLAIGLGVALGEGLRDFMEGYELDDTFGFIAYVGSFVIASYVIGMRPLNRFVLVVGALVCAAIQSGIEAVTFLAFGSEGVGVALWAFVGNTISHGLVWGALPLVFIAPALHGRFERYLGFTPKRSDRDAEPLDGYMSGDGSDTESGPDALVVARHLTYRDPGGGRPGIQDLSFELDRGVITGVIGRSGCGADALCRVLAGLAPRSLGGERAGWLSILGEDPNDGGLNGRMALIGEQATAQIVATRPLDELVTALGTDRDCERDDAEQHAHAMLDAVGLDRDRHTERTWELDESDQLRVVIAAALITRPDVILVDNAARRLDAAGRQMLETMIGQARSGAAVLLVDNDRDRQRRLADRLLVLDAGRLEAEGAAATLLDDTDLLRRVGLIASDERPITMFDRQPSDTASRSSSDGLRARGLRFGYRDAPEVLGDVDLTLRSGEILALLGADGQGKTTLAHILAGLRRPSGGGFTITGESIDGLSSVDRLKRVGFATRDPHAFLSETSGDREIAFPLRRAGWRRHDIKRRIETLAAQLDLDESTRRADPLRLLPGAAKRIQIAAVLALEPRVLILDEPALYLDPMEMLDLADSLRKLAARGLSVLIVDNDLELAIAAADRLAVLDHGRLGDAMALGEALAPDCLERIERAGVAVSENARRIGRAGHPGITRDQETDS